MQDNSNVLVLLPFYHEKRDVGTKGSDYSHPI